MTKQYKQVSPNDLTTQEIVKLKAMLSDMLEEVKSLKDGSNEKYDIFATERIENIQKLWGLLNDYTCNKPSDKEIDACRLGYTE